MNSELFNYWQPFSFSKDTSSNHISSFNLNFGPQHPASHGVLSMILQMRGEIIERVDTHIGLLHSGTEKLIEGRPYLLGLPYFDRLDYTSILMQEHGYCLAIEDLMGNNNYFTEFSSISMIFDELTRILNHLIALSTHSMDVGTMSVFFWAFEESERMMEFYERVSGARMHAAFYSPNELSMSFVNMGLLKDMIFFCRDLFKRLAQIEYKLNTTTIWRLRLAEVGMMNPNFVYSWGVSGVLASSAGVSRDLSLLYGETYDGYYYLNIRSFIGTHGDCYDSFLISMSEMAESIHIMMQIISGWIEVDVESWRETFELLRSRQSKVFKKSHPSSWSTGMEELIEHFKYWGEGFTVPSGLTYKAVESAKGEFGVFLVSDGSVSPYRCSVRSPAFFHTQLFAPMTQGHYFADLITIIGSQDIVMGEVDS